MAKKSKSQRAKATAAKANRKERQLREESAEVTKTEEKPAESAKESKGGLLKKKEPKTETKPQAAAAAAKKDEKPKKVRFKFIKDVRAELKRVTWPTRSDVLRWSGVVVCALLFFGIFTAVLDNLIVTPALVALSGLGA